MLFNSIEFALFLPLVFSVYWLIGNARVRAQNAFLLVASYVFYGWWDWRFLSLIAASSILDFLVGWGLDKNPRSPGRRRWLLAVSLGVNLGLLGFFKYYNFFAANFAEAFTLFGISPNVRTLNIVLPVGISFYTFQTLSYTIDVYRGRFSATRDWVSFFAYVSFFPQLVAGPIERASNLLPQFLRKREFSYEQSVDGLRQILWGLFKKIVVADTCAIYCNEIFANPQDFSSAMLLLGAVYFAFQIYGDFSGYSDIAIGVAKLFGFRLMRNFAYPYFSRDIAEFWRRWHISLSTWFRDYLYIPLGGSRHNLAVTLRNVAIIFVVSGFWHGANWTFVIWGALHALYFMPLLIAGRNRGYMGTPAEGRRLPSFREGLEILATFALVLVAWVFFRAQDLAHAVYYLRRMLSFEIAPMELFRFQYLIPVLLLVVWEWVTRDKEHGLAIGHLPRPVRWAMYFAQVWMILFFFGEERQFIYFQF